MRVDIIEKHLKANLSSAGKSALFRGAFAKVLLSTFVAAALLLFLLPVIARADTAITQGYVTESEVALGSIVSLQKDTSDEVSVATTDNADNILGVVINDGSSLIKLSSGRDNQVQVATSGVAQVLVSDINGEIKQGDHITASPIGGIGMLATSNVKAVGIAQSDLTPEFGSRETYTDKDGEEFEVLIGEVPVIVNVAHYFVEPEKSIIPPAIQNLANSIAGKTTKPLPIIISAAIFIVTLIAVASIIFSMIRNSIISVGRNPMSQSAVYRNLIQISALVLVILSVAVVSIYMVLTRF